MSEPAFDELEVEKPAWATDGYEPLRCTHCHKLGWYPKRTEQVCDYCGKNALTDISSTQDYKCRSCDSKLYVSTCPNCPDSDVQRVARELVSAK